MTGVAYTPPRSWKESFNGLFFMSIAMLLTLLLVSTIDLWIIGFDIAQFTTRLLFLGKGIGGNFDTGLTACIAVLLSFYAISYSAEIKAEVGDVKQIKANLGHIANLTLSVLFSAFVLYAANEIFSTEGNPGKLIVSTTIFAIVVFLAVQLGQFVVFRLDVLLMRAKTALEDIKKNKKAVEYRSEIASWKVLVTALLAPPMFGVTVARGFGYDVTGFSFHGLLFSYIFLFALNLLVVAWCCFSKTLIAVSSDRLNLFIYRFCSVIMIFVLFATIAVYALIAPPLLLGVIVLLFITLLSAYITPDMLPRAAFSWTISGVSRSWAYLLLQNKEKRAREEVERVEKLIRNFPSSPTSDSITSKI